MNARATEHRADTVCRRKLGERLVYSVLDEIAVDLWVLWSIDKK